ncbi:MAG: YnbE family lipoprotein [Deltaproteobacteria bacterium]|nr:YnbE family lipoprotein [Deltaproteobacteria bacterium]
MKRLTPEGTCGPGEAKVARTRVKCLSLARSGLLVASCVWLLGATGCAPTVAIEAPKEPIVINMNIKIEHEIRVNVDQDLEALFEEEEELF